MKTLGFVLGLLSLTVAAQQAAQMKGSVDVERRTFISAADLSDIIAKADVAATSGKPVSGSELLGTGAYRGVMQYLTAPMKIFAQHQDDDELFVVLDGAGSITLGARLINPRRGAGATTLVAESAEGGVVRQLAKGDMFVLPVNTSRSVTRVDGKLVMMSMRLPHAESSQASRRGNANDAGTKQ